MLVHQLTLHSGRRTVLRELDLRICRGELVAIAGASGAGKTTLLRVIAGLIDPTAGDVEVLADESAGVIGYVPQDDIVPLDLTVDEVLTSAAALRLPGRGSSRASRVDQAIERLRLEHVRTSIVRQLSGGERKRVNLAVELLAVPDLLLLDEPTSGLDPSSAATILDHARSLVAAGTTVVLTSHSPLDIERCDRVVFLGRDGQIAYDGPPPAAPGHFGVEDLQGVYRAIESLDRQSIAHHPGGPGGRTRPARRIGASCRQVRPPTSFGRQLNGLARRNVSILLRNRAALSILVGAPILVTAMMLCLFPRVAGDGLGSVDDQIAYWLAFAAFFFGLTDGLLQVVPEVAIVRRDRIAGVRLEAYVLAKLVVLGPLLVVSSSSMALVLSSAGRLPTLAPAVMASLCATLALTAIAALVTGLMASTVVADTTQAALALPLVCFPNVLFAGAVAPRSMMAWPARAISEVIATRWGFDAVRGDLTGFAPGGASSPGAGRLVLGLIAMAMMAGTLRALRHRTDPLR